MTDPDIVQCKKYGRVTISGNCSCCIIGDTIRGQLFCVNEIKKEPKPQYKPKEIKDDDTLPPSD